MGHAQPNRLLELRLRRGLTRVQVAAALGVESEATVTRWELGKTGIPDERKLALSKLYEVPVAHLMGWDDPINRGADE